MEYPVINDDDRYAYYWCRNDYPLDYTRDLYKHIIISRYPDGSIRTPQGAWVHMTGDFYTDGKRYLYISPDFKNSKVCPFLIHEVRFGVMSFSTLETVILSIPSIKQQYSIPKDSDHLECKFHETNYVIWHTAGGYLVSFSGDRIPMTTNISTLLTTT